MQKASVIDLGSNSVKLVNFHIDYDNSYKPYQQEGIRTKLGEELSETGFLGEPQMQRALDALKLCRDIVEYQEISHVLPVATSAVREAANNREFLEQIFNQTGFHFRILSEEEEALYSYVGAIRSLRLPSVLFFDIGGGSLEIVYSENYEIKKILSLPLGALRLTQMYADKKSVFSSKSYEKMQMRILDLVPSLNELNMRDETVLVGVGGTLRTLAKYDQALHNYPLNKVHNYRLQTASINSISKKLFSLKPEKISKIDSISSERSETITAGACVINLLAEKLGFEEIVVSAQGLREGTLSISLEFPKEFSTGTILHAEQIQNSVKFACEPDVLSPLIEDLVRSMISINELNEKDRVILAHSLRYMSKFTSIRNPDNLLHLILDEDSSLSHKKQIISALSIIYSKKRRKAEKLFEKYDSILKQQDKTLIRKISSLATLCDILEKTETDSKIKTTNNQIIMEVYPNKTTFPNTLFKESCIKFSDAFGIDLKCTINFDKEHSFNSHPIKV